MCQELKIAESVNSHIVEGDQRTLSHGDAVVSMILNGLGFTGMPLYMTPHYFEDKPVELLIGEGIEARHINDVALGRTLDKLYEYGISNLFSKIASQSVKTLKVESKIGHLDSTAFAVHTKYDKSSEDGTVEIVKGHSKDYRPDLNQIALNMIVENRANLPVYIKASSGNQSDKVAFGEIIEDQIKSLKNDFDIEYIIVDSALYTKDNIAKLNKEDIWWITRVPNGLKAVKEMIAHIDFSQFKREDDNYSFMEIGSLINDVNQRWMVIHSKDKAYRNHKSTLKKFTAKSNADIKAVRHYEKQIFVCKEDALKGLELLKKGLKNTYIEGFEVIEHRKYSTRGKPKKGAVKDVIEYSLSLLISSNLAPFYEEKKRDGIFVLATNQLDSKALKIEELLSEYKHQQKVERGFRFLKDPKFHADSIFLKKPERIASLMMIMTLSLLVYSALEYKVRKNLKEKRLTFPNQKGKLISNPTTRWIFQYFYSVVLILLEEERAFDYFNDHHAVILECLGDDYWDFYS